MATVSHDHLGLVLFSVKATTNSAQTKRKVTEDNIVSTLKTHFWDSLEDRFSGLDYRQNALCEKSIRIVLYTFSKKQNLHGATHHDGGSFLKQNSSRTI